jgi:hypothetical protein
MKSFPYFTKQLFNDVQNYTAQFQLDKINFNKLIKFTTGQIVSSGSFKYEFYDIDNHLEKDKIQNVTYYRGDFTTADNAFFPKRTKIVSYSDNHTNQYTIEDDFTARYPLPLENGSSIICINQKGNVKEEEVLTLIDVLTLNSNEDAIVKFIEANTYLIPLEGDLYINGQVRKNKEWLYIKESKELVIKGIDNALLAVFK